jgi:hypothetical protein
MTPRVQRREWESNPATIFAGLFQINKKFQLHITLQNFTKD